MVFEAGIMPFLDNNNDWAFAIWTGGDNMLRPQKKLHPA